MRFSLLSTLLYLGLSAHAYAQSKTNKPYLDKSLPISARVDDLFNRLTLEEKVGQTLCVWNAKRKFIKDGVLDAKAAAPFLKNGIGQVARPNEKEGINGYSPRQTVKLGNEIQRYLINKTRLGIS